MKLARRIGGVLIVGAWGANTGYVKRWSDHRTLEQQRITELERHIAMVKVLETRVHDLEAAVQQLRQPTP